MSPRQFPLCGATNLCLVRHEISPVSVSLAVGALAHVLSVKERSPREERLTPAQRMTRCTFVNQSDLQWLILYPPFPMALLRFGFLAVEYHSTP